MDHISTVIPTLFQNFMEVQLPEHLRIILKATAVSSNPRQLCDDKNSHNLTPGQIHFKQMKGWGKKTKAKEFSISDQSSPLKLLPT